MQADIVKKVDALFAQDAPLTDADLEVPRALAEQMKKSYQNGLVQCQLEMRVAMRLKDEEAKKKIREQATRLVEALEEMDAVLAEA